MIAKPNASSLSRLVTIAVVGSILGASMVPASPVPVFQFVLEHWEVDPYQVVVHHDGELTEQQQAALGKLLAVERGQGAHANIAVTTRDHGQTGYPETSADDLPRVEVRFPIMSGIRRAAWNTDLTPAGVDAVLDSAVRQQIVAHLLERKAAVWVLLESGNKQKDEQAIRTLERELPLLASRLKVPERTDEWKDMDVGEIQRDVEFAVVRLSRDDPQEQMLVNMLLELERDLRDFDDEPIVFPIYGRGLMMYALLGEGINESTIAAAGEFLVGPCSTCQIKTPHTGVDMLMSVDWDEQVEQRSHVEIAGPGGFGAP